MAGVPIGPYQTIIRVNWGHPFLACDAGGLLSVSSDLVNWRTTHYTGGGVGRGAYGNGRFVALRTAPSLGVIYSPGGGRSWFTGTDPFPGRTKRITFGQRSGTDSGLFAVVDVSGETPMRAAFSEDGLEWSYSVPPIPAVSSRQGIGFASGRFFVFGGEGFEEDYLEVIGYDFVTNEPITTPATAAWTKGRIASSIDGSSWTAAVDPFASVDDGTSGTITITDPSDPTHTVTLPRTIPDVSRATTFVDYLAEVPLAESNKVDGTIAVVVGDAASFSDATFARSPNGLSGWQVGTITDPSGSGAVGELAYGNGIWIGVETGNIYRSTDGLTWSRHERASLDFPGTNPITFAKDHFVACHLSDAWVSTDGITFERRPSTISTNILEIVY